MATQDELDELYARNLATMRPGSEVAPVRYDTSGPVENMPSISGVNEAMAAQAALQDEQAAMNPELVAGEVAGDVPGGVAGDVEVQVAGQVPGQVVADDNPYLDKAARALESGAAKERAGVEAQTAVEASKSKQKTEAMSKADREASNYALAQKTIAEQMDKMDREFEQRNIADEEEVRRAYQQRVDPSRYWANKDAGQKAMSVIAAGLFGYLGKGMEYLKRLDNLVAEDVRLQENERANKIAMAEKIQAKHGQNYKTLRDAREQAYENSLRAENKMWMGLKHTLEAIDVSHAGQAAEAQKGVALAHIDQNLAKGYMGLAQIQDKEKTAAANLALREMALMQRRQTQQRRLPPQAETGLQHRLSYIQALERMRAEVAQAEGLGKVGKSLTSFFGEGGEQKERFQQAFHDAVRERSQSALQQHEIKYFGSDLPGYNDWLKSSPRQLDAMIQNAYKGIQEYANTYQKRGFDVDPQAYAPSSPAPSQTFKSKKVE